MRSSGVYFISDGTFVKIGKGNNPMQRLRNMQTGNGKPLELLLYLPFQDEADAFMIERTLHFFYKKNHVRGEWYDILESVNPTAIAVLFGDEDCLVCKGDDVVSLFNQKSSINKLRKEIGIQRPHFRRDQVCDASAAVNSMEKFFKGEYCA